MAEEKLQKQRALDPNTFRELKEKEDEELPPRGTGRRTGTAKNPTGPGGRLTEEERKKRHKQKTG